MTKYNMSNILAIIIILILIILILRFKYGYYPIEYFKEQNQFIEYYDFNPFSYKNNKYKQVVILSGVHGNEPAGCYCLKSLLKTDYFYIMAIKYHINIRIIPCVNKQGLIKNTRFIPNIKYPDINRNFPDKIGEKPKEPISEQLLELVKNANLILDFHEGWGFHQIQPDSLGSTLTCTPDCKKLSELVINNLNENISQNSKHFVVLDEICDIQNTLSCYCTKLDKEYILIETTGQDNIQPINLRADQIFTIIDTVLKNLHFNKWYNI